VCEKVYICVWKCVHEYVYMCQDMCVWSVMLSVSYRFSSSVCVCVRECA